MTHPNTPAGVRPPPAQGIPRAVPSPCLPEGPSLRAGQRGWHRPRGRDCHCALTLAPFQMKQLNYAVLGN